MEDSDMDIPVNAIMNMFNRCDESFHKKVTVSKSDDSANVLRMSVIAEIEMERDFHAKIWASALVYEFERVWFPIGVVEITIKTYNEHKFPQKLDISYMFNAKFNVGDAPTPNMKINDLTCSTFTKLYRKHNKAMNDKDLMLAEDEMMRIALIMS